MQSRHRHLDLTQVRTTSLRKRHCNLLIDMLGSAPDPSESLQEFYRSLPRLGSAAELLGAAECLTQAALNEKDLLWLIDAAVLEAGLSPLLIRMIQRGLIQGIAMTGSAALRDYELAVQGMTVEDVGAGLRDGLLGMSRETGEGMNTIINDGVRRGFGLGECLGRGILDRQPKYFAQSLLAACAARLVPATVHVTIGADGFHRHPNAEGTMLGKGSLKDLQILGSRIEKLHEGGVLVAAHRSAALHDVFLHAYGAARNLAGPIQRFSLVRFSAASPDFSVLPDLAASFHIPGPLELILPLFTGVVFSLVE